MIQGDSYYLAITVKNRGQPIEIGNVERAEIMLLNISKTYPEDVRYEDGKFYFPLTQEQTRLLPPLCPMQVRVKFSGGSVIGAPIRMLRVGASISREVL